MAKLLAVVRERRISKRVEKWREYPAIIILAPTKGKENKLCESLMSEENALKFFERAFTFIIS
jgi:hypothetical protein